MQIGWKLLFLGLLLPGVQALLQFSHFQRRNTSLTCEDVHLIPNVDRCLFVKQNCDTADHHIGMVNYLNLYYCTGRKSFSVTIIVTSLVFSFVSLGLTASDYLCPNLYTISKFLDLSDNLAGLTLLAVGNGSPDVLGTFKALNIGSAGLAVSELVGAALFILTVVVGSISIVSPFKVPKYHFMRDVMFYTVVSVLLWFSLVAGQFNVYNSAVLALVYVVYVIVAVYSHSWLRKNTRKQVTTARMMSHFDEEALAHMNDDMDQSYFDQLSGLPSIDILSTKSDEDFDAAHEFGYFLKRHPHDASEERAPVETGSYGLRVLLRELSKHSIHLHSAPPLARIQWLTDRRSLTAPATTLATTDHNHNNALDPILGDEAHQSTIEEEIEFSHESMLVRLSKQFLPDFGTDGYWFANLTYILCAPTNALLKLTTPNREQAIEFGEYSVSSSNAFSFQFAEQQSSDDQFSDFDFESDTQVFRIQMVAGTFFLIIVCFRPINQNWIYAALGLTLAGLMVLLLPTKAPKFEKHLLGYRVWNYFGSFFGFLLSLLWISVFATEIIAIIKAISVVLELSDDILGSTIFALGNSIGDLVSNLTIASMGMPVMAFGACFGGPLLSLCSLGLSSIFVMRNTNESAIFVNFSPTLKLNLLALLMSQVFIMAYVPRNGWKFDRKVGVILISFWVSSVASSILLEVNR